jgi:hypothetical protein
MGILIRGRRCHFPEARKTGGAGLESPSEPVWAGYGATNGRPQVLDRSNPLRWHRPRRRPSDLPTVRAAFPNKYLGLPLSIRRLQKVDFQPLLDKAAAWLSGWRGRNITQSGRVTLTKSVLFSQPIYLLTALSTTNEVLNSVDRLRQKFLLRGMKTSPVGSVRSIGQRPPG